MSIVRKIWNLFRAIGKKISAASGTIWNWVKKTFTRKKTWEWVGVVSLWIVLVGGIGWYVTRIDFVKYAYIQNADGTVSFWMIRTTPLNHEVFYNSTLALDPHFVTAISMEPWDGVCDPDVASAVTPAGDETQSTQNAESTGPVPVAATPSYDPARAVVYNQIVALPTFAGWWFYDSYGKLPVYFADSDCPDGTHRGMNRQPKLEYVTP